MTIKGSGEKMKFKIDMKKIIQKIIQKICKSPNTYFHETLDPEEFDTVWILDDDKLYSGFIFTKTRRRLLITYYKDFCGFTDVWFNYKGGSDPIYKDNLILYFKNPCSTD